jgi:hypothetical protein
MFRNAPQRKSAPFHETITLAVTSRSWFNHILPRFGTLSVEIYPRHRRHPGGACLQEKFLQQWVDANP